MGGDSGLLLVWIQQLVSAAGIIASGAHRRGRRTSDAREPQSQAAAAAAAACLHFWERVVIDACE